MRSTAALRFIPYAALPLLIAGFSQTLPAQSPQTLPAKRAPRPTSPAITAEDLMTRVYIFADDSMLGRRAGHEGNLKATAYIANELRRMGAQPAGDNGTYFQYLPMFRRSVDTTATLTVDGARLRLLTDFIPLHGGGVPRPIDAAQVIYVGTLADTVNPQLTVGKVALINGRQPGIGRRYPGAAAFIVAIEEEMLAQVRPFASEEMTYVRSAADTGSRPLTILVPQGMVQSLLGVTLQSARPGQLGKTLRGSVTYREVQAQARNVVAVIPGRDPRFRGQYVALGAHSDHDGIGDRALDHDSLRTYNLIAQNLHYARTKALPSLPGRGLTPQERAAVSINLDSLRRLRPARADSIYNGADDDASGSMALLEVAEMFARSNAKPRRSLLFVWHTAEELGLLGALHFTSHATVPRDSIVAMLNVDMIGRGEASDIPGGGPGYVQLIGSRRLSTQLGSLLEDVNGTGNLGLRFDYTFDAEGHPEQYYCRSDHYAYARFGIPVAFLSTGGHRDYHMVTDEPQYISYPKLTRLTRFLAAVADRVGSLNQRPVVDKPKPDPNAPCRQ